MEPQQRRVVQWRGRAGQPARAGRARRTLAAERDNQHVHQGRAYAAERDAVLVSCDHRRLLTGALESHLDSSREPPSDDLGRSDAEDVVAP
jgi:hypothetical protein